MRGSRAKTSRAKINYWKEFKELLKLYDVNRWLIALISVVTFVSSAATIGANFLIGYLFDNYLTTHALSKPFDTNGFIWILVYLVICYLTSQLLLLVTNVFSVKTSQRVTSKMRIKAYNALMKMPVSYFESQSSGRLMSTLTNDIDKVSQGLLMLVSKSLLTLNYTILCLGFVFWFSPYLGLLTIGLIPILYSIMIIFIKIAMPQFRIQQDTLSELNGHVEEVIKGQHLIRSFNKIQDSKKTFDRYNDALLKPSLKANIFSSMTYPYSNFASMILQLIVVIVGALLVLANKDGGNGILTIGSLSVIFIYLKIFTNQIIESMNIFSAIQMGIASSSRIRELINLKPQIDEDKLQKITTFEGDVRFEHVNFSYTNNPNNLQLKDASFWAKKGQTIAIVGPTGAGKTTIVNLLSKFYLPLSGKILLDNMNILNISAQSWRDQISIVLQDTFLFKGTILENLRYGNLEATEQEIIDAAKMSFADGFIQQLENGYETVINQSGGNLSQGERQLIAITRAILANKNILVLDEATSNVDTQTEKKIQQAMLNLMKGKTSFVIAHRLSTIVTATCILVVNDGQIVEKGSHEELMALNGIYTKMYNSGFEDNE